MARKCTWLFVALSLIAAKEVSRAERHKPARWISALNQEIVKRRGDWREDRFRYAAASHLHTTSDGAVLELDFEGSGVSVRLAELAETFAISPAEAAVWVSERDEEASLVTVEQIYGALKEAVEEQVRWWL